MGGGGVFLWNVRETGAAGALEGQSWKRDSCSKGPASSGSGARLQSTSLGTCPGVKPGSQLASETEEGAADSRFLSRPRDGTKGGTVALRSRTASRSTDPAGSHLAATASSHEGVVRGAGLGGHLRRERATPGTILKAEGARVRVGAPGERFRTHLAGEGRGRSQGRRNRLRRRGASRRGRVLKGASAVDPASPAPGRE